MFGDFSLRASIERPRPMTWVVVRLEVRRPEVGLDLEQVECFRSRKIVWSGSRLHCGACTTE